MSADTHLKIVEMNLDSLSGCGADEEYAYDVMQPEEGETLGVSKR